VIDHHGAAYPDVGDPKFSGGFGLFVRWSRSEAKWLVGLGLTATGAAVAAMCVGPHLPLCAAAVAGIWYVTQTLTDWGIDRLYDRGCRLETRILPWTNTYVTC